MYYSSYKKYDVLNGVGLRHSLFVSGCTHYCKGCFNKRAWDFTYGEVFTEEMQDQIIKDINNSEIHIKGLSVLGGEPFDNVLELYPFIEKFKTKCVNKDLWIWSGYTFEEIVTDDLKKNLLTFADVLIDGRYMEEKRDLTLKFRGSSNQRVIDVQKTLSQNKIVLLYKESFQSF
ncbi:MAG: anaerobic ribonucleoside-triphosphate reductase activating protein [Epulopiscium sp.]|nr:anaerobic ribonucleoside-triphosphate reductase activating protein [Candidatus Epulonipiscium sp.]